MKDKIPKSRLRSLQRVADGKTEEGHAGDVKAFISLIKSGHVSGETYPAEKSAQWQRKNPGRCPKYLGVRRMSITPKGIVSLGDTEVHGYARRDDYKRKILQAVSDYGKPMPVSELRRGAWSRHGGLDREPWASAFYELSGLWPPHPVPDLPVRTPCRAIEHAGSATIDLMPVARLMPGPDFVGAGKSLGVDLVYWEPLWVSVPGHPHMVMIDDVWCPELRRRAIKTVGGT